MTTPVLLRNCYKKTLVNAANNFFAQIQQNAKACRDMGDLYPVKTLK
jgi:hypothetical protein